jgi:site-specific DNA-methyltransferase (adenine-specific)
MYKSLISEKRRPGEVRDAILSVLSARPAGASLQAIEQHVADLIGNAARSSVRSYLRLNTPSTFIRIARGHYGLKATTRVRANKVAESRLDYWRSFSFGKSLVLETDCLNWLREQRPNTIHAVVTDPPYGLFEYSSEQQEKLRKGKGGVWRIPPSFDGVQRAPLPRFTVLSPQDLRALELFFLEWAQLLIRVIVPGANVVVASNPLLSYVVSGALAKAGLERRGEIVRLVMTMRGGDRPKAAHEEFPNVSVMPRSMWEPWLLFRRPLEGRAQDNLRKWGTGGFRRPSSDRPFGDVITSAPTHKSERALAPHPSLKPQQFMRTLVRGVLPLGEGVVLDPFCGAGSTLAAAESVGYESVGIEKDPHYFEIAKKALPKLALFKSGSSHFVSL